MEKDEMGDLIIDRPITIQEFYDFACQEGIQDRILNIVVMRDKKSAVYTMNDSMLFGPWWSKKSAVLTLKEKEFTDEGGCVSG